MKNIYEWHGKHMKDLPLILHYHLAASGYAYGNLHENVEFQFFTEGEGKVIYDGRQIDVAAGDLVCINSHVIHQTTSESRMLYHCLIIDADFCRQNGIDTTAINFTEKLKCDEKTRTLFFDIVDAYNSQDPYAFVALRGYLLLFISHLAAKHSVSNVFPSPMPENIILALSYMKSHIDCPLTLDTIAKEVGLSRFHFAHRFKELTGYSPLTYLTMLRMEHACTLLNESDLPISDIALACGFETPSYFARTFNKIIGVSPSGYRADKYHG